MQLTVKLRHRRCQGNKRHGNGYHGDNSVTCRQPRSRHAGLAFDGAYVQQTVKARNILAWRRWWLILSNNSSAGTTHALDQMIRPRAVDYRDDDVVTSDHRRPAAGEATESTVDPDAPPSFGACQPPQPARHPPATVKTRELLLLFGMWRLGTGLQRSRPQAELWGPSSAGLASRRLASRRNLA